MLIQMNHFDDGKKNLRSHEIYLKDTYFYNEYLDMCSHSPFGIQGYGETKDEAVKDFIKKFECVMDELRAFEKMLIETDVVTDNIIDVDCLERPI